jgi:glutamine synthetase
MFVFDIRNDLPGNEFVNMSTGYLDCRLVPDISTGRILTHRPGYALVLADVEDSHGQPHPLAPRNVLRTQLERCRSRAAAPRLAPVVATELEFYPCTPNWQPVQDHCQPGQPRPVHLRRATGAQRRADPQDDLVTALVLAEDDGDRLSPAEYRNLFHVLVFAGNETTRTAMSQGAMAFAHFPDQWRRLGDDPSLLDSAVEGCCARSSWSEAAFCTRPVEPCGSPPTS